MRDLRRFRDEAVLAQLLVFRGKLAKVGFRRSDVTLQQVLGVTIKHPLHQLVRLLEALHGRTETPLLFLKLVEVTAKTTHDVSQVRPGFHGNACSI